MSMFEESHRRLEKAKKRFDAISILQQSVSKPHSTTSTAAESDNSGGGGTHYNDSTAAPVFSDSNPSASPVISRSAFGGTDDATVRLDHSNHTPASATATSMKKTNSPNKQFTRVDESSRNYSTHAEKDSLIVSLQDEIERLREKLDMVIDSAQSLIKDTQESHEEIIEDFTFKENELLNANANLEIENKKVRRRSFVMYDSPHSHSQYHSQSFFFFSASFS